MIVSVVNRSGGRLSDAEILRSIRAVNRQVEEDFQPYWGFGATLRLEGRTGAGRRRFTQSDMRGDAVLYVVDGVDVDGAEGFHESTYSGIPYGIVFLGVAAKLDEEWTVTFSHEALELIADPEANLLVQGPHPTDARRRVFHWFEMCDAVQTETYCVDGIRVSNFVLPLYFTSSEERGGRNDFFGTTGGQSLRSFGVNPGGYIGFYDPRRRTNVTYFAKDDEIAAQRARIKRRLRTGRGSLRRRRTSGR